ncbi:phosphatidylinositol N-acetylglucosaminyltransferase subunit P-like isoform X1 [Dinothrombium tinctorium]|uniref:Phosphatidylinositol N-acetylglucosaminyltransferase subunit P n=1 Tax=Dinothrombium tinctorium TaxID=1965070 RepID=A0A443RBS0_9ACAR|nr:phosphatidylinositol N-acetylglucosaminyltransferase subunit P-like isoform X1 [Dinothrombium tinctorium]RWS12733.1 phosphatidylinositol N-acetylglucosaminyltransferase subunit P-like isoform X1 [Dinothrombium tinctorium]RWS13306.1 phosphatidylinositol N-acetylglucosaminyltransferase subunit P-like isoform X1 [Dinothrombium tinctorium]
MSEEASPSPNINRSVYGYVLLLLSNLSLIVYCIWAFVPDQVLIRLGLTYSPSKYWCLAIPVYCGVAIAVFALFIYPGIIFLLTKPLNSINTITDRHSKYNATNTNEVRLIASFREISPIFDLSIDEICRRIYIDEKLLNNELPNSDQ